MPPKDDSLPFLVSSVIFKLAKGKMVLPETSMLMFSDFYSRNDCTPSKIAEPASAREVIEEPTADGPGWELQAVDDSLLVLLSNGATTMEQLPLPHGECGVSCPHPLTMHNSYCPMVQRMKLPWVGVNRGLTGEERNSKRLPKMICDVSCIFKTPLCQCAYKGISSTAFFTIIILERRFFRICLSSFQLTVRNILVFDAQISSGLGLFFKWCSIQNIQKPCGQILPGVGNCAGIRLAGIRSH